MTNYILLTSSVVNGIILLIVIAMTYQTLPVWLPIGICLIITTSCWNHGTTNEIVMWCDRVITTIIAIILLYFLLYTNNIPYNEFIGSGLTLAAVLLLVSYQYTRTWRNRFHLLAHIMATISVVLLCIIIYLSEENHYFPIKKHKNE
jgi:hypothetical protein